MADSRLVTFGLYYFKLLFLSLQILYFHSNFCASMLNENSYGFLTFIISPLHSYLAKFIR